jgi:hypothetical protein
LPLFVYLLVAITLSAASAHADYVIDDSNSTIQYTPAPDWISLAGDVPNYGQPYDKTLYVESIACHPDPVVNLVYLLSNLIRTSKPPCFS